MTTNTLVAATVAPQAGPSGSPVNLGQKPNKVTYTLTVTGPAGQNVSAAVNIQAGPDGANYPYANQMLAQGIGSATANLADHTPMQYFQGWVTALSPGATATVTMLS